VVDAPYAVLADRAHAQLRLEGHAEFAHQDDVQRRSEVPGDFRGDRDAAPRQAEDDHVLVPEVVQTLGQAASSVVAIGEIHGISHQLTRYPGPR
jgi:hypothetical protein